MKKTVFVQKMVEVVDDLICNKCGRSTKEENFEGLSFRHRWGYGSPKDGELDEGFICEACFDEFAKTFLHPCRQ